MTVKEIISGAALGSVVQVCWCSALFDSNVVIKMGQKSPDLSKVFSCGFLADKGDDYITIAFDALYEPANTDPSFRTILTIYLPNIISVQVYGSMLPADTKF